MRDPSSLASPGTSFHQPRSMLTRVASHAHSCPGAKRCSRKQRGALFTEWEQPSVNYALRPSLWVPMSHMTPPP